MDRSLNENSVLKNIDGTPYIAFPAFDNYPELVCGFSTRLGGVSRGIFASMNLGFNRGDPEENVFENYRRICRSMGICSEQLVFPDQVHDCVVRRASAADRGKGITRARDYAGVDSQITDEPGVALVVFGADCVPVFFYDPVHRAIGVAHAGWKGTAAGIVQNTVLRMQEEFHTKPSELVTVIGPSIGQECYEVGAEVAAAFRNRFEHTEGILRESPGGEADKYMLNLWEANRRLLADAGIATEHITVSGLCTMCRQELLFSHRATAGKRGSLAGFLMLREYA